MLIVYSLSSQPLPLVKFLQLAFALESYSYTSLQIFVILFLRQLNIIGLVMNITDEYLK